MGGATFCYLPKLLAATRFYNETKTLGQRLAVHREINEMLKRRLGRVPDKWILNYAHVWAEHHGIDRTQEPERFVRTVVRKSLWAAWHWNKSLTPRMVKTVVGWWLQTR
jgi:hypothetical protein